MTEVLTTIILLLGILIGMTALLLRRLQALGSEVARLRAQLDELTPPAPRVTIYRNGRTVERVGF